MKRLLIVADHSFVVEAIRLAMRQTAGFELIGFVDGRASVRAPLVDLAPDIVLVDDMQHHEHALARLAEIAQFAPDSKRILLTLSMDQGWLEQVAGAGADAALSKTLHPGTLGTLVREIANGTVVHLYPRRAQQAPAPDCPLTERELEILRLVAEGHTNGSVARQLWVTEQTVKFHLSNTYRKLGVANRTEATRYAHVHDLVEAAARPLAV